MKTLVKSNGNFPEIPSVFDDFIVRDLFNLPGFDRGESPSVPSANVKETEKTYELELAAPGMKREDFKVQLDGQVLTISAEKEEKNEEQNSTYTRKEFSFKSFKRSFTLPERTIDAEKITARYNDGILNLTIPKLKEAIKTTRMIEIS